MTLRRLFAPDRSGRIRVRLDPPARELLHALSEELRELLLVDESEDLRRLYPTAYPDDEERNRRFDAVVHDQLLMARLDGIDTMQETLSRDEITIDEADAWMNTINQIRLVLGTRLDVSEDDTTIDEDDPEVTGHVVYQVMSHVLDELTTARAKLL